ncbi:MAG: SUMF1/EgtB/PvdO family nonheme iron enzyme [Bacteroidota bacterium]
MAKQKNRDIVFDNFPTHHTSERIGGVNHLLAIGIDDYDNVAKLSNAVRDAKAFVQIMQDKYEFSPENIYTLYDKDACKHKITETFRSLIDKVDKVKDNLIIYFSGHGMYDQVLKEGYWVPADAKYKAEVDYISYSYIKKVIKAIPSHHTVMIVDSCYSGSVLMGSRDLAAERVERDPSRWMLASGRNEVVPDGVIGGNSPFAENLLSILDRYSDKGLRIGTLIEKLTTAVSYNSKQTPIGRPMYEVGDQGGEFFFHPKQTPEKAWAKAQLQNSIAAYTSFLAKYANSSFAQEAKTKLEQLQAEQIQATPPKADTLARETPAYATTAQATGGLSTAASAPAAAKGERWLDSPQNKMIAFGSAALAVILLSVWFYYDFKDNKAENYTEEAQTLLSSGSFSDALAKSTLALTYVADYPNAEQLKNKAQEGQRAQAFMSSGKDSLDQYRFQGAIKMFKEARQLYIDIPYSNGIRSAESEINGAKAAELAYQEQQANSQVEKERIHQENQLKYKELAWVDYIEGEYEEAVKLYNQVDDSLSVANEIKMAQLGVDGQLPEVALVSGHTEGDFYMSKYEVTNEQFCTFLNDIGRHKNDENKAFINLNSAYTAIIQDGNKYLIQNEKNNKNRPVTGVSWYGAQAYAKWAGGLLPSAEQWRYAAREGSQKSTFTYSGSSKAYEVAVYYNSGDKRSYPAKVGTKAPNALDLYDMSGNAWEWTSNGSSSSKQFVMGGSINRGAQHAAIESDQQISVSKFSSQSNNNDLGFRIIRMVPQDTDE